MERDVVVEYRLITDEETIKRKYRKWDISAGIIYIFFSSIIFVIFLPSFNIFLFSCWNISGCMRGIQKYFYFQKRLLIYEYININFLYFYL